ncbi:hypothetical protein KI387_032253, partial [Taxus chinensis]
TSLGESIGTKPIGRNPLGMAIAQMVGVQFSTTTGMQGISAIRPGHDERL